jgi:hypothetical protein
VASEEFSLIYISNLYTAPPYINLNSLLLRRIAKYIARSKGVPTLVYNLSRLNVVFISRSLVGNISDIVRKHDLQSLGFERYLKSLGD